MSPPAPTENCSEVEKKDAVEIQSLSECSSSSIDSSEIDSDIDSEYPDDIRVIADMLVTNHGEVLADVLAGIRDALDKMNKILYRMCQQ